MVYVRDVKDAEHGLLADTEPALYKGMCVGRRDWFQYRHLEVDNIAPGKKGGLDNIENLQLLCGICNRTKGTRSQAEFVALMAEK